ncbi:MAG: trigger factor [Flavobacteriales bacterium]|nr:trigger factor [Flavobacteriales bacterium]
MNITKEQIDDLNAIVTIEVAKEDYTEKVEKVLADYRKNANVPGFRKGNVPMSLIKKQYGLAVLSDEVNKLLQESLNNFLTEEKLDILGNPLPKVTEDFSWDSDSYKFEFELGLSPEFELSLKTGKKVTKHNIIADKAMIDQQIESIKTQYGKISPKEEIEEGDDVHGTFTNEEKGIDKKTSLKLSALKGKRNANKFLGKKAGDVISLNTKGLFEDDHDLIKYLGVSHDDAHGLEIDVDFTITEVTSTQPAELNQELFDRLFGEGKISSEEELRNFIKEDAEKQFATQADQQFLNDISEYLIENTTFDLPAEFLKKWLQTAGEKQLSAEEATAEYERSEKGLRYQLIEGKIIRDNNLQITFEELKAYTGDLIKGQMAQFGQLNPSEKEVEDIVARVLSNQEEVRRLSDQSMSQKMMNFFKENATYGEKEVTYEEFIKNSIKA